MRGSDFGDELVVGWTSMYFNSNLYYSISEIIVF